MPFLSVEIWTIHSLQDRKPIIDHRILRLKASMPFHV
jgi:hypothetical protein